jgi:hypothetical protein
MNVSQALRIALADAEYTPRDTAAVALAVKLAGMIDDETLDAKIIGDLGMKLLTLLTALGMTPAARAALTKGVTTNAVNPSSTATIASLREFSDTRRARLHTASDMDATP